MRRISTFFRRFRLMTSGASLLSGLLLTQTTVTAEMVVDLRFADGSKSKPAVANQVETIQIWARIINVADIRDSEKPEGIRLIRGNIRSLQIGGPGGNTGAFAGGSGFGVVDITNQAGLPSSNATNTFVYGNNTFGGLAKSNRNNLTNDTLQDWGGTSNTITATAATAYDPPTTSGFRNGNSDLSFGSGIIGDSGLYFRTGNNFTGHRYFPAPGFVPPTADQASEDNPPGSFRRYGLTDGVNIGFTNTTGNAHYLDNAGNVLPSVPSVPTAGGVEFHIGNILFNGGSLNTGPGLSTQLVWSGLNSFAFMQDGLFTPSAYVNNSVLNTVTFTGPTSPILTVTAGSPVTINVMQGGTVTGTSVTLSESTGIAATGITGTPSGSVSTKLVAAAADIAGTGNGPAVISLSASGSQTVGTFTGTVAFAAAGSDSGFAATPGSTVNVTLNVGNASLSTINSSTMFGPAMITNVVAGATVNNLSSNSNNGVATSGSPAALGTTATILRYVNSNGTGPSTETVSMAWRTRTAAEANPANPKALLSDVVRLTGMNGGSGNTGTFVLQMTYDLPYTSLIEESIAASGELQLAWLNDSGVWVNAVVNNFGGTPNFAGVGPVNLNAPLGTWGVDTNTDTVWAVLNHNSDFAVIPEPSTLVMGALSAIGLGFVVLRRRRHEQ